MRNRRTQPLLAGLFVVLVALGVGLPPVEAGTDGAMVAVDMGISVVAPASTGGLEIGDRVWEDLNRDGIQDDNEPGVAGIVIALEQAATDGHRREVGRTITDLDGRYTFDNLIAAWYGIRVLAPAGWRASTPGAVPADPTDDAAIGTRTGTVISTEARFVAEDQPVTDDLDVGIFLPNAAIRVDTGSGSDGSWVLDVSNDGPEADPGPLMVSAPVPAELDATDVVGDGWNCALENQPIAPIDPDDDSDPQMQVLSCIRPEGLVDGATASITVTGRVLGSDAPQPAASAVMANVIDRVEDDQLAGLGELAAAPRIVDVAAPASRLPRLIIAIFAAAAAVFAISRAAWRPADLGHL